MVDALAVRYRCTICGRTFRYYPEGVSRYRQSQQVMGLAVLLWTLGLPEWATSHVMPALEAGIHRSSVHRDRLRAGALLQQRGMAAGRVRALARLGLSPGEAVGADDQQPDGAGDWEEQGALQDGAGV